MPRVQFGRGSGPDWNPQTVLRQSHQRPSTECLRGGPDLRSVCPVGWTRARIIELERRAKSAFALRVRRLGKLPNSAPKLFESWTPFFPRDSDRFTVTSRDCRQIAGNYFTTKTQRHGGRQERAMTRQPNPFSFRLCISVVHPCVSISTQWNRPCGAFPWPPKRDLTFLRL